MSDEPTKPYNELGDDTTTGNLLVRERLAGDGVAAIFVASDPRNRVAGVKGQLAIDQSTSTVYQNTDDAKSWSPLFGGSGGGATLTTSSVILVPTGGTAADAVKLESRRTDLGTVVLDVASASGTDRTDLRADYLGVRETLNVLTSPVTGIKFQGNQAPSFFGTSGVAATNPPPGSSALYGDQSDGSVTDPASPLARDTFYDVLTLSNGYALDTAGFSLSARVIIAPASGMARIHDDGVNGATAAAKSAASLRTATAAQGAPSAGAGGNGGAATNNPILLGQGGAGGTGNGGVSTGGAAGTRSVATVAEEYGPSVRAGVTGVTKQLRGNGGTAISWTGGSGGGAGGGDGAAGGRGGGGGGRCAVLVGVIRNPSNLTVSARGGVGQTPASGNKGGGGGGGGGLVQVNLGGGSPPVVDVSGGAAGAGVGTGVTGVAGTAGVAIVVSG